MLDVLLKLVYIIAVVLNSPKITTILGQKGGVILSSVNTTIGNPGTGSTSNSGPISGLPNSGGSGQTIPTQPPSSNGNLVQFTPDQSDWNLMNELTLKVSSVRDHSPDGVLWVKEWPKWDGKVIDVRKLTNSQIQSSLCTGGIVHGSRELYYEKPFRNPKNPTKAEVDDLHIRTILHLRRMVGVSVPLEFDRCLCSIAFWSEQVRSTEIWTQKYPRAKQDFCYVAGHCDFTPDAADQQLTFNGARNNQVCTTAMTSAEGIGGSNADIPWSLKFHRTICSFLGEGVSGHPGPLFRRTKLCPNFYYSGSGNGISVRLKSGGVIGPAYWE